MTSVPPNTGPILSPDESRAITDYYRMAANARIGQWDEVREALRRHRPLTIKKEHFLLEDTFVYAAKAGRVDILKQMYAQGYTLFPHVARETLNNMVAGYNDTLAETVIFLAQNTDGANAAFICKVAGSGSVAMMKTLKEAGCDILHHGSSFYGALRKHQPEMMKYLYQEGAYLYFPLYIYNNPATKIQKTLTVYNQLVEDDCQKFKKICPEKKLQPRRLPPRAGRI
jgi:hypothetical protein